MNHPYGKQFLFRGRDTGSIFLRLLLPRDRFAIVEGRGIFTGKEGELVWSAQITRGKGIEPFLPEAFAGTVYVKSVRDNAGYLYPRDPLKVILTKGVSVLVETVDGSRRWVHISFLTSTPPQPSEPGAGEYP